MLIAVSVQSFYTLDPDTHRVDRDIQLFGATYLAFLAFLPIPVVLLAAALPRPSRVEKFGQGRFRTKLALLLATAALLTLGAGFRAGVAYDVRPANKPAWFHHKACYYCFNYLLELLVVYAYAIARFDRRFHVPDGSSRPGHYAGAPPPPRRQGPLPPLHQHRGRPLRPHRPQPDRLVLHPPGFGSGGQSQPRLTREWETSARDEQEKQPSSYLPT